MDVKPFIKQAEVVFRRNSPAILTGIGMTGVVTTGYLSYKAGWNNAISVTREDHKRHDAGAPILNKKEAFKLVWKSFIPPVVSGVVAIGSLAFATKIGNRRTAAMTAAYSLSERALIEYKDKVVETIGVNKEQKIRDELIEEKVRANAPGPNVILSGAGDVLCCELYTGRYFKSDMESLRKAQNDINAKLNREQYASLSDFYYILKWPYTTSSSEMGWNAERQMELDFSTSLTEDGRPCLAFEYNYVKPL